MIFTMLYCFSCFTTKPTDTGHLLQSVVMVLPFRFVTWTICLTADILNLEGWKVGPVSSTVNVDLQDSTPPKPSPPTSFFFFFFNHICSTGISSLLVPLYFLPNRSSKGTFLWLLNALHFLSSLITHVVCCRVWTAKHSVIHFLMWIKKRQDCCTSHENQWVCNCCNI